MGNLRLPSKHIQTDACTNQHTRGVSGHNFQLVMQGQPLISSPKSHGKSSITADLSHMARLQISPTSSEKTPPTAAIGKRKKINREDVAKFDIPPSWVQSITDMGFTLDCLLLIFLWKQHLQPSPSGAVFEAVDQVITWMIHKKDEAERNFGKITHLWPTGQPASDEGVAAAEQLVDSNTLQADESQMCKICFLRPAVILLRPCSHLVSCESCTRQFKLCPICRVPITATISVTW